MNSRFLLVSAILFHLSVQAWTQKVQIGTNAVGLACMATLNAEVNYGFARHWTVGLSGKYNPFTYGKGEDQMQLRQRSIAANAKWWPWHIYSGWWAGALVQWQEYNMGGVISPETEEGRKIGGGLMAGYSYMLTSHLNLDMGFGLWGGMKRYAVYACPKCGRRLEEGTKAFFLPSDVILSVSYVF